ncbi:MAG: alpha/beta hydrolase [Planctomycetota bacterium]
MQTELFKYPGCDASQSVARRGRRPVWVLLAASLIGLVSAQPAAAQKRTQKGPPEIVDITLSTKDGVDLHAKYAASDKGKNAIPILLIHEWKGQATQYSGLMKGLQGQGYAVMAIEYRGHGRSTSYTDPAGRTKKFNLATMSGRHVQSVIAIDLEAAKKFLVEENNDEKLNLNSLVVLGVREGCIMAMHWSRQDWAWPSIGAKKQGQDVKAIVLVSPEKILKGLSIDATLRDGNLMRLPIMILDGRKSKDIRETERLAKQIKNTKTRSRRGDELEDFRVVLPPTTLSGPALLRGSGAVRDIAAFIAKSVDPASPANEWIERK